VSGESITILHLSDLQFGRHHLFAEEGACKDAAYDTLFQRLRMDLRELDSGHELRPDLVILTGDLAEWARSKEFEQLSLFAGKLQEHYELPRRRILVVPGNHDVNRKHCEAYFNECDAEDEKPEPPYFKKWKNYERFFALFYEGIDDYEFNHAQPWTLFQLPELKVVVAGLNSTMAESHREEDHYGHVGEEQLQWFAEHLTKMKRRGWLRIGAVHHNVVRMATCDDENLRDAGDMRRILGPLLNLILHGHTHESGFDLWEQPLPILSTGSASVKAEARPDEVPNQYQFVRVERNRLSWWRRMYARSERRFVADCRYSPDGNSWARTEDIPFVDTDTALRRLQKGAAPQFLVLSGHEGSGTVLARARELVSLCESGEVTITAFGPDKGNGYGYLRAVIDRGHGIVRHLVVGVFETCLSEQALKAFLDRIVAREVLLDRGTEFLVLCGEDPSPELRLLAEAEHLRVKTLAEYRGEPDLRPAVASMLHRLRHDSNYLQTRYVHQHLMPGLSDSGQAIVVDAAAWLENLLRTPEGKLVLILGSFGTGKTFLMRQVALRLGQAFLDRRKPPIPLLIEMRSLERAQDVDQLLTQSLTLAGVERFDLRRVRYMLERGDLVLLFDGFDELALRVRYERAAEHLERILRVARGGAKLVITSRTQHFIDNRQVETALLERMQMVRSLETGCLQPFAAAQIEEFLVKKLGPREAQTRGALIRQIHDLPGLSKNPRLLDFITELSSEDLEAARDAGATSPAEVYERLVRRWLDREQEISNPQGMQAGIEFTDCWEALQRFALGLWTRGAAELSLGELDEVLRELLADIERRGRGGGPEALHAVGARTLLVRDGAGRFRFIHQSVMEWFVARTLVEQLDRGTADMGQALLSELMVQFLAELGPREALVNWARGALVEEGELNRKNAFALLQHLGEQMQGIDLTGLDLRGQQLGKDLREVVLRGADLRGMRLDGCDLRGADLRGADLRRAVLDHARLEGANLEGARLDHAHLRSVDLQGCSLAGASLHYAVLLGAQLPSAFDEKASFGAVRDIRELSLGLRTGVGSLVALSPDGEWLASPTSGVISIWEVEGQREVSRLVGHRQHVSSLAWSPDGASLASAGDDGTVRIWDVGSSSERGVLEFHDSRVWGFAWSPNGASLASVDSDWTLSVWDMASLSVSAQVRDLNGVESLAWSPDGMSIATAGSDGTVVCWDVLSSSELARLPSHNGTLESVAWLPNRTSGAVGVVSADGVVKVWDMALSAEVTRFQGHTSTPVRVAWSSDGAIVAIRGDDRTVRVWDLESSSERAHLHHDTHVLDLACHQNGATVATVGSDETVRMWDVASSSERARLEGYRGCVVSVAWSPHGQYLAVAGPDDTVRVWDMAASLEHTRLAGHDNQVMSVAWSPDGASLASAGMDGTVRVWDIALSSERSCFPQDDAVESVTWSPDGASLAVASYDGTVSVWDVASGLECARPEGHGGPVRSVAWSPDGASIASAGLDGVVNVSHIASSTLRASLVHDGRLASVAWSPDGASLASAVSEGAGESIVTVWDVASSSERAFIQHDTGVEDVAWSPDGASLASAAGFTVTIWSVASTTLSDSYQLPGEVTALHYHPAGRWLAAASSLGTLTLIDTQAKNAPYTLLSTPKGWAILTVDGRYKTHGEVANHVWLSMGFTRFELDELDPWLPAALRLPPDWRMKLS